MSERQEQSVEQVIEQAKAEFLELVQAMDCPTELYRAQAFLGAALGALNGIERFEVQLARWCVLEALGALEARAHFQE